MRVVLREPREYLAEYEVEGLPPDPSDEDILAAIREPGPGVTARLITGARVGRVVEPSVHMRGEPDLARVGRQLAEARAEVARMMGEAQQAAKIADAAAVSERAIAGELGVNRATVRGWLGK